MFAPVIGHAGVDKFERIRPRADCQRPAVVIGSGGPANQRVEVVRELGCHVHEKREGVR